MTSSNSNRRKTKHTKITAPPTGPSKERSCETCRKRKVRCSEDRPACSNCIKSSLANGKPVCCVYSQRSIFYSATDSASPSQSVGDQVAPQLSGHRSEGGEASRGSEAPVAEVDDDAHSTTPSCASPFDRVSTPSTINTSPPCSPSLTTSELCDQEMDDGLVDYDAEGETDDEDMFEARPILASSLLAAPPSTPFAASFPSTSFGAVGAPQAPHFQPPPNPLPLHRTNTVVPRIAIEAIPHFYSLSFGPAPSQPRAFTASLGVRPPPPPPPSSSSPSLRADGTLASKAGPVGFWDEGPLSKDEVMGWESLQWFAS